MKENTLAIVAVVLIMAGCGGCVSGLPVTGVVSYKTAQALEHRKDMRNARAAELPPEQHSKLIRSVNMGHRMHEVAVGLGVDLLAIPRTGYTAWEIGGQVAVAVAEGVVEGLVLRELYDAVKDTVDDDEEADTSNEPQYTTLYNAGTYVNIGSDATVGNVSIGTAMEEEEGTEATE